MLLRLCFCLNEKTKCGCKRCIWMPHWHIVCLGWLIPSPPAPNITTAGSWALRLGLGIITLAPNSQVFGLVLEFTLLALLVFQCTDCRSCNLLVSIMTWVSSCNNCISFSVSYLCVCVYIYTLYIYIYILFLWRTFTGTFWSMLFSRSRTVTQNAFASSWPVTSYR